MVITRDRLKSGSVCGTCFVYIYIYIMVYVDSHSLDQLALASKRTASTIKTANFKYIKIYISLIRIDLATL